MRRFAVFFFLVLTSGSLHAAEIAPTLGWLAGGAFDVSGGDGELDDAAAFGMTLSFERGSDARLDFVYLGQRSSMTVEEFGFDPYAVAVAVDYLHFGGRYLFRPGERNNPWIGVTAGISRIALDPGNSVVRPSATFGVGTDLTISDRAAIRLDARWWTALVDAGGELSCASSGTCIGFGEGGAFRQFSATAGLVIRY